jgi:predicted membrane channel-forming protein YqfA (hemolysin III family)
MKLTAPKQATFWIGVALGVLGLLSFTGTLTILPIAAFWLLFLGFLVLVLGLLVKGL